MAKNPSCGCMGALNCIHGPLSHCCPPPAKPEYYENFPYYSGPCPPCECEQSGCGGHRCKKHCRCGCHCEHHCGCSHDKDNCAAGMFYADAPLSVSAGEAVPLSADSQNGDCFEICDGCIRIKRPGRYHVVWTLNVPSYQNFSGCLYLSLNGSEVNGSCQTVCCQADNTSTSATGQAMIRTGPTGLLCLVSDCNLCFSGGCSVQNVVTVSITRAN